MSKKNTFKKIAAVALGMALTVGATGCNFFPTNNEADLKQVIAKVNISETLKKDKYAAHADSVAKLVKEGVLTTDISKRELISSYLSNGSNYTNSGYSSEYTFNALVEGLVANKIITQHAVAYYLENGEGLSAEGCLEFVEKNMDKDASESRQKLLKQVLGMEYFLTENGKTQDDYLLIKYQILAALNASLDSIEQQYIKADEEEHNHSEARTTPKNVATEKDDYYPKTSAGDLNYAVYTGRNADTACGAYEKVEGSTVATRKKAYNSFLANLYASGFISKDENTSDITDMDYFYMELASNFAQALVNKYGKDLKDDAVENVKAEYIAEKYNEIKEAQGLAYATDAAAFETALGSVSDESFVLYGKKGFGFVYNILLPFSAAQEQVYAAAKNKGMSESELFNTRKNILKNVEAKDLRTTWFDLHDHANYAYEVTEGYYDNKADKGEKTYLFFEDNMTESDRYESFTQYLGQYPYNGKVEEVDHEYKFTPNTLDIDGFIGEMESYINYAVGSDVTQGKKLEAYETTNYKDKDNVVDYSKFMYYAGKADLKNAAAKDFFNAESDGYKALSAVNELMFAYSTDAGCLNTYMGYAVSPYKTSYVSEFEYAAQYAVSQGVGSYVVCATDYGWHIIYTTFVYEADGDVYGGYNAAEIEVEGTFSNLFYESLKSTLASTYTTDTQNNILNLYNNDSSVTLYKAKYQDLLDMAN